MRNYQGLLIDKIDKMNWLEIVERERPIDDVHSYLNYVSRWPLFLNMASAALCMGFSAIFHLFFVYS